MSNKCSILISEEYVRGMWYCPQRIAMGGVIVLTLKNEMPLDETDKQYLFLFIFAII